MPTTNIASVHGAKAWLAGVFQLPLPPSSPFLNITYPCPLKSLQIHMDQYSQFNMVHDLPFQGFPVTVSALQVWLSKIFVGLFLSSPGPLSFTQLRVEPLFGVSCHPFWWCGPSTAVDFWLRWTQYSVVSLLPGCLCWCSNLPADLENAPPAALMELLKGLKVVVYSPGHRSIQEDWSDGSVSDFHLCFIAKAFILEYVSAKLAEGSSCTFQTILYLIVTFDICVWHVAAQVRKLATFSRTCLLKVTAGTLGWILRGGTRFVFTSGWHEVQA